MRHIKKGDIEYDEELDGVTVEGEEMVMHLSRKYYTPLTSITCNFIIKNNGEIEYE